MQAFLQSHFLEALTYALINSIWQMAFLWAVVKMLTGLFSFLPSQKFNIAFVAQVVGFIIFIFTFLHAFNNSIKPIIIPVFAAGNLNNFMFLLLHFTAVLYLAILLYKSVDFFLSYRVTQHLRRYDLYKIDAEKRIFVSEMSALFRLHKKVNIYLSAKIKCPLTIGYLKPVILIPLAAISNLTSKQLEAIILHELAHIKRADYILFILQSVIDKLFFFNIFSKMLSNIIECEREHACDDYVLQFKYNSLHYAEALLKLGYMQKSLLALPAIGKNENLLFARIKRLMNYGEKNVSDNYNSLLFSFSSLVIALCLIFFVSGRVLNMLPVTAKNESGYSNQIFVDEFTATDFLHVEKKPILRNPQSQIAIAKKTPDKKSVVLESNEPATVKLKPVNHDADFLISVNQYSDSLNEAILQINSAINNQIILTPETFQQALSYKNFKQLERMLSLTGDSITVKENDSSKDSYKKLVTIETIDKNGSKHIYNVVIELYQ